MGGLALVLRCGGGDVLMDDTGGDVLVGGRSVTPEGRAKDSRGLFCVRSTMAGGGGGAGVLGAGAARHLRLWVVIFAWGTSLPHCLHTI